MMTVDFTDGALHTIAYNGIADSTRYCYSKLAFLVLRPNQIEDKLPSDRLAASS